MAFNLTVSAITPPDGLPHADRKTEIMELPTYLRVTGASGASELKLVFVSASEPGPDNIDNVWLKIDETGRKHGFYIYDAVLGTWLLMAGPGVYVGTTAPDDINILWLKTDSVDAILTVDGSTAVAAPQGLYQCVGGTLWTCFTTTAAEAKQVIIQAAAPTGATDTIWVKTASEKGVWYWTGAAWLNASAPNTVAAGTGANYIQTSAAQPSAALRNYVLWAKTGNAPNGLFYPDATNEWWQSIHPIHFSRLYPATAETLAGGHWTAAGVLYSAICPTIGTAVFSEAPVMSVTLEYDTGFTTPGSYLNWAFQPSTSNFGVGVYNPGASRDVQFRVGVTGHMRIPFA
jgi:hypothetical protein